MVAGMPKDPTPMSADRIITQLQEQLSELEAENAALEAGGGWMGFRRKMEAENLSDACISAFRAAYESLIAGKTGMIGGKCLLQ